MEGMMREVLHWTALLLQHQPLASPPVLAQPAQTVEILGPCPILLFYCCGSPGALLPTRICPFVWWWNLVLPSQRPWLLCLCFGSECLTLRPLRWCSNQAGGGRNGWCQADETHEHCSQSTVCMHVCMYVM